MSSREQTCEYCGLPFAGGGYDTGRYCCYGCYLVNQIVRAKREEGMAAWILIRLGIGAFLGMNVMMISLVLYANSPAELGVSTVRGLHWALLVLSTPAMAILSGPFISGSVGDVRMRRLGTDGLILTGSMAAYLVSVAHVVTGHGHVYFDTATMLLLIVTLGRLMEAAAKVRTSNSIREVTGLLPASARVLRDCTELEIPLDDIREGDVAIVKPGERIPADGRIVWGESLITESAITGESKPRTCSAGDTVFGGSAACDGSLRIEVTAVDAHSLLSQIQEMVRHAQSNRAPIERLAERFAAAFVPVVWAVAAGAGLYWGVWRGDTERAAMSALAVLVVACPCALGLATPIATCLAIGAAARKGLLIGSGEVLERLSKVGKVFFDKTGTLTTGLLSVQDVQVLSEQGTESEALGWAAALEASSEHAVARAIIEAAESSDAPNGDVISFRAIPGQGVRGTVRIGDETREITVGSPRLFNPLIEHPPPNLNTLTTIHVGWDGRPQATISLQDSLRDEAKGAVSALRALGVAVAIISGDREAPTRRVAHELGIDHVLAECSPTGKAEVVRDAHKSGHGGIAMVGDGINDAPALAEADVGIAIGGGTDLARHASDVTLIGDDLSRVPEAVELSKQTYRIIRQNLWWAFGYNGVAMAAAALGFVHPLIAAVAMFASSSTVIANSMRVTRSSSS